MLCEKRVIHETCKVSVNESELYPDCAMTRAVTTKKAKKESRNDVSGVQVDRDGDMTLSETVYSDWCNPGSVETVTAVPRVMSKLAKGVALKLLNSRKGLTEAPKSDTNIM